MGKIWGIATEPETDGTVYLAQAVLQIEKNL